MLFIPCFNSFCSNDPPASPRVPAAAFIIALQLTHLLYTEAITLKLDKMISPLELPGQNRRILINLIHNAVKYWPNAIYFCVVCVYFMSFPLCCLVRLPLVC